MLFHYYVMGRFGLYAVPRYDQVSQNKMLFRKQGRCKYLPCKESANWSKRVNQAKGVSQNLFFWWEHHHKVAIVDGYRVLVEASPHASAQTPLKNRNTFIICCWDSLQAFQQYWQWPYCTGSSGQRSFHFLSNVGLWKVSCICTNK